MEDCFFIHPDNAEHARRELGVDVAIIARPDWYLQETGAPQVVVETVRGVHTRCFLCEHEGLPFLLVYGRFGRVKGAANEIDYELTQEAVTMLGATRLVGTFSVGSVRDDDPAGAVYVPHDFIGLGGYGNSRARGTPAGVRNVDMFRPFCDAMRGAVVSHADRMEFPVRTSGVYACFHGWPRYETRAELESYARLGCAVVGQTLDPEATLAKEAGAHYVALAATIDDYAVRERLFAGDMSALDNIDDLVLEGRRRTFELFLDSLKDIAAAPVGACGCAGQAASRAEPDQLFYYRPPHLISKGET